MSLFEIVAEILGATGGTNGKVERSAVRIISAVLMFLAGVFFLGLTGLTVVEVNRDKLNPLALFTLAPFLLGLSLLCFWLVYRAGCSEGSERPPDQP